MIVGGGIGLDIKVGGLSNGESFFSITPKAGVGFDIGISAEIETGYYHGLDDEYAYSLSGLSMTVGGSLGLGMEYNRSLDKNMKGRNPNWTGTSYTGGADAGVSGTINYTFILSRW